MSDRAALFAFGAGWRLIRRMPERLAYLICSVVAQVAWLRQGTGVRQLEDNFSRVFPQASPFALKSLSRKGMHSYLRYWCDVFRMADWSSERILATCRAEGDEPVRQAVSEGRGVVMALAHQGNWDHAGAWAVRELAKVTTVAEHLTPEELFRKFVAFRERLGLEVFPLATGVEIFGILSRRLHEGGLVPLLVDRDLGANGVPVRFFGEQARMAAGPAALAAATGAALFPVTIYYERLPPGVTARWGVVVRFHPEVVPAPGRPRSQQVEVMTQQCADALAAGIRAHPQDWHMLQRVFLDDLVPETPAGTPDSGRAS